MKDAEEERKMKGKENMDLRIRDAEALLGSILTEKPELPPDVPVRDVSPKRKKSPPRDKSPKRYTGTQAAFRDISPKRQTVTVSPKSAKIFHERAVTAATTPAPREQQKPDYHMEAGVTKKKGILKTSKEYSPTRAKDAPHVPRLRLIDSDEYVGKADRDDTYVPRLGLTDSDDFMRTAETTGMYL